MFTKRLIVFALLTVLALGSVRAASVHAASPGQSQAAPSATLVGSWLIMLPNESTGQIQFTTFTSDGLVIGSNTPTSLPPPAEPLPPGVTRLFSTDAFGAWAQTGDRQYVATFENADYDQDGNVIDITKIVVSINLDASGNSASGPYRVVVMDPSGNTLFASPGPAGNFTATRISPEPF